MKGKFKKEINKTTNIKTPEGIKRVGKRAELVPEDASVCELSSQLFASSQLSPCCIF